MNTQTDRTVSSHFEYATRTDGSRFVVLTTTDDTEWIRGAVMAAHDGELPNDWRFETAWHIVAALEDGAERDEVADSLVDVYTADLIKWLGDDISRLEYCDTAREESGGLAGELVTQISGGQYWAISQMVDVLADAIAENGGQS